MMLDKIWTRHGGNIKLAVMFFVLSSLFVELFAGLSLEYGAQESGVAGACRWDCGWYSSIVQPGYDVEPHNHPKGDAANWAFFPAFPLVVRLFAKISGAAPSLALVVTSKAFLLIGLFAFITFVEEEIGIHARFLAGGVLAFHPYIIYAHAGYTESLYFSLTTLAFYALRRDNWIWAGVAGGLLSATRLVGLIFVLSYMTAFRSALACGVQNWWPRCVLGLLLCPFGLGLYMVYLHFHVGDALAFMHIGVAWGTQLQNPIGLLVDGLKTGGWITYSAYTGLVGLIVVFWFMFQRRYEYAIFMAGVTLVPLAAILQSMPRYVFWQMPLLLALVEILMKSRMLTLAYFVVASAFGGFVILSWFAGKSFVV